MAKSNQYHTFLKAEAKGKLLERYDDLKFIDDVTELSCKRCNRVLIHHYIANCGHLFCRNCQRILGADKGWKCPECQTDITDITVQNAEVEARVSKLKVHCPNSKYGCKVDGSLRLISEHLDLCMETRDANLPVLVDYSESIINQKLSELAKQLEEMRKLRQADEDKHVQMQIHLDLMEKSMIEMRTENANVQKEIVDTRSQVRDDIKNMDEKMLSVDKQVTTTKQKVTSINKDLSNINIKFLGIIFFFMVFAAICYSNVLEIHHQGAVTEKKAEIINNKLMTDSKKVLDIDNKVAANTEDITTIFNQLSDIRRGLTLGQHPELLAKIAPILVDFLGQKGKENDTLFITDFFEQLFTMMTASSNPINQHNLRTVTELNKDRERLRKAKQLATIGQKDGHSVSVFTWMVEDMEYEIEDDTDEYFVESQSFYTNVPGYKVKLKLFPNYKNSGYIGVFLILVEGEFDDILSWPFNNVFVIESVGGDGKQVAFDINIPRLHCTECGTMEIPGPNNSIGCGSQQYINIEKLLSNRDQYLIEGNLNVTLTVYQDS